MPSFGARLAVVVQGNDRKCRAFVESCPELRVLQEFGLAGGAFWGW